MSFHNLANCRLVVDETTNTQFNFSLQLKLMQVFLNKKLAQVLFCLI